MTANLWNYCENKETKSSLKKKKKLTKPRQLQTVTNVPVTEVGAVWWVPPSHCCSFVWAAAEQHCAAVLVLKPGEKKCGEILLHPDTNTCKNEKNLLNLSENRLEICSCWEKKSESVQVRTCFLRLSSALQWSVSKASFWVVNSDWEQDAVKKNSLNI